MESSIINTFFIRSKTGFFFGRTALHLNRYESEMIMNEKILKLLNTDTAFYPVNLEQKFPLILEKIIQLWGTAEFDSNISKLMLDTRNHMRQGFPPEVASDILRLSLIHTEQHGGTALTL